MFKYKFGYIDGKTTKDKPYRFELLIINETPDIYEVKYGKNMISGSVSYYDMIHLSCVLNKNEVVGVHEKQIGFFRWLFLWDEFKK